MTRVESTRLNFEREPLRAPWGFKGRFLTECWQSIVRLSTVDGRSAVGLGVQSVLWSDPDVFASCSEAAGNAAMLLTTSGALEATACVEYDSPGDLLDSLLPRTIERARNLVNSPSVRTTFALNALVPVDCAAWRLQADSRSAVFDTLIPEFARKALGHRQERIACVPAVGYGMSVEEISKILDAGFFVLKIKIGSDPNSDGDREAMLAWDCERIRAIHSVAGDVRPTGSPGGSVYYYLDANGRYDNMTRVVKLMEFLSSIGALDRTLLLEEPFAESNREEVGSLPVRVAADESAHTVRDVIERIDRGYGAIVLKPAAKTLTMSFRMAAAAADRGVPCFCADLTVNPALVEWNKLFAAHLAPLPGIGMQILECNGFQNYRNWTRMIAQHPDPAAAWIHAQEGMFQLDDAFFERSGGAFMPCPYYEALVP